MTQETSDESTNLPQSAAVVQRKTRGHRLVREWMTRYGLQPVSLTAVGPTISEV